MYWLQHVAELFKRRVENFCGENDPYRKEYNCPLDERDSQYPGKPYSCARAQNMKSKVGLLAPCDFESLPGVLEYALVIDVEHEESVPR